SFKTMAERQQALAAAILKDRDVQSLSSFIGVDGANTTLNSGRILINLKPHERRTTTLAGIMERIKEETDTGVGITLTRDPVQHLTSGGVVSRTPYRFILQDANPAELAQYVPKLVERLKTLPQLTDVATDLSAQGLAAFVDIDRDTAGRFGITPATVDNALYD